MRGNSLATVFSGFCFLLPPMLVLSSTSVAPLIVVAAIAACLSVWRSGRSFPIPDLALVAIFGVLLLWGATTTLWTVEGASALMLVLKLAILFLAGLLLLCTALLLEPEERRRTGRAASRFGARVMVPKFVTNSGTLIPGQWDFRGAHLTAQAVRHWFSPGFSPADPRGLVP